MSTRTTGHQLNVTYLAARTRSSLRDIAASSSVVFWVVLKCVARMSYCLLKCRVHGNIIICTWRRRWFFSGTNVSTESANLFSNELCYWKVLTAIRRRYGSLVWRVNSRLTHNYCWVIHLGWGPCDLHRCVKR